MLPFKRILLPVDYSDPCLAVVPYVKEMAGRFSASLTLMHAYEIDAFSNSLFYAGNPNEAQKIEETRLRLFAREAFSSMHADCIAVGGEPGSAVEKVIRNSGIDLVMLPTHGRGPLRRMLLGSVTAKVLHDFSVAVWTGAGKMLDERPPRLPYKSILCTLDDTNEAEAVLRTAAAISKAYQADLSIIHVIPTVGPGAEIDYPAMIGALTATAETRLREMKAELAIDAPHCIGQGMVADAVRLKANKCEADLIVAGRGLAQTAFSRIWSSLYCIIRDSPCPVLSI